MGAAGISLRKAVETDKDFLLWLRKTTMAKYLLSAGVALSDAEHIDRINSHFDCAEIILFDGVPVGLLKACKVDAEWVIQQIQISPEHQGHGLGSKAVDQVLRRAVRDGLGVSLSVIKQNPARRLYERLGFEVVGECEGEFLMTWKPCRRP